MLNSKIEEREYYKLLNIDSKANLEEIKKSYKKMALEFHPDRNKNPDAEDRFKDISKAYQVLSDSDKRRQYDLMGDVENMSFDNTCHFDIFNSFFGDMGKSFSRVFSETGNNLLKSEDRVINIDISLTTLYYGKIEKLTYKKKTQCTHCLGTGAQDPKALYDCNACFGQGVKIIHQELMPGMVQQVNRPCSVCNGVGKMLDPSQICKTCNGNKIITIQENNEIYIEPGMDDKDKMYINRGADIKEPNQENGDIILIINSKKDDYYQRFGPHLYRKYNITLLEALTTFQIKLDNHPNKNSFFIDYQDIITPDTVIELKGYGMPLLNSKNEYGNLYIQFKIIFPQSLSNQRQEYLKKLLPIREQCVEIDHSIEKELTNYNLVETEKIDTIKTQYIRKESEKKPNKSNTNSHFNPNIFMDDGLPQFDPQQLMGDMNPGCSQQ